MGRRARLSQPNEEREEMCKAYGGSLHSGVRSTLWRFKISQGNGEHNGIVDVLVLLLMTMTYQYYNIKT